MAHSASHRLKLLPHIINKILPYWKALEQTVLLLQPHICLNTWTLDTFLLLRQTAFIVVIQLQIWCTAALGDWGWCNLKWQVVTNSTHKLFSGLHLQWFYQCSAPIAKDEFLKYNSNAPDCSSHCGLWRPHSDSTMLAPCLSLINAAFTSFLHYSSLSRHITPILASPYLSHPPLSYSEACFDCLLLLYVKSKRVRFSSWYRTELHSCVPYSCVILFKSLRQSSKAWWYSMSRKTTPTSQLPSHSPMMCSPTGERRFWWHTPSLTHTLQSTPSTAKPFLRKSWNSHHGQFWEAISKGWVHLMKLYCYAILNHWWF